MTDFQRHVAYVMDPRKPERDAFGPSEGATWTTVNATFTAGADGAMYGSVTFQVRENFRFEVPADGTRILNAQFTGPAVMCGHVEGPTLLFSAEHILYDPDEHFRHFLPDADGAMEAIRALTFGELTGAAAERAVWGLLDQLVIGNPDPACRAFVEAIDPITSVLAQRPGLITERRARAAALASLNPDHSR